MDEKHSPLPWKFEGDGSSLRIRNASGGNVTVNSGYECLPPLRKDMAFIVECVNQHYELLDALARYSQDSEAFQMGRGAAVRDVLRLVREREAGFRRLAVRLSADRSPDERSGFARECQAGAFAELAADVERLGPASALPDPYDDVKAERDRYRKALEQVVTLYAGSAGWNKAPDMADTAKEALKDVSHNTL